MPSYSSAALCFVPDLATEFYRTLESGEEIIARTLLTEFYLPLVALRDRVAGYAVSLPKAGATLRGLPMGSVRPPLVDVYPEHLEQLAALVDRGRAALRRIRTPLAVPEVAA